MTNLLKKFVSGDRFGQTRRCLFSVYNFFGLNLLSLRGRRNKICFNESIVGKCKVKIAGNNNSVVFGKGSAVRNVEIYITGNNSLINLGDYCLVKSGSWWVEGSNCKITIGDRTTIESAHIACTEDTSEISIGDGCMFASDIDIRTGDSHSIINLADSKRINTARNVEIKDHVWIAAHVVILKGVTCLLYTSPSPRD